MPWSVWLLADEQDERRRRVGTEIAEAFLRSRWGFLPAGLTPRFVVCMLCDAGGWRCEMVTTGKRKDGRHPFKWLLFKGEKVRIDRDIVPLIKMMWELGIETSSCCQSDCPCPPKTHRTKYCDNYIWIAFQASKDLERFYDVVAEWILPEDNDSMYGKMSCDRFVKHAHSKYLHDTPEH